MELPFRIGIVEVVKGWRNAIIHITRRRWRRQWRICPVRLLFIHIAEVYCWNRWKINGLNLNFRLTGNRSIYVDVQIKCKSIKGTEQGFAFAGTTNGRATCCWLHGNWFYCIKPLMPNGYEVFILVLVKTNRLIQR